MSNDTRRFHNKTEAALELALQQPERMEAERRFAEEHRNDTDEELIDYAAKVKMRAKGNFKRQNLIGYCYFVERFKDWSLFVPLVKQRIAEIKENPALREEYLKNRNKNDHSLEYAEKLERALQEPERMAKERQFAIDHAKDTDFQLRNYLIQEKLEKGKLRPLTFIGYRYIEFRFGSWAKAMKRVNQEIAVQRELEQKRQRQISY